MTATIEGHGVLAPLPEGWTGRIYRELLAPPEASGPIMHAGNFAIPAEEDAFAPGLMTQVGPGRVGFVYAEYLADEVIQPGKGLYSQIGFPEGLSLSDFDPATLQVRLEGLLGFQYFVTVGIRCIVLYAVIGEGAGATTALEGLNALLSSVMLAPTPESANYLPVPKFQPGKMSPPPSVSSVSPSHGPRSGGTAVTVAGANFLGATHVILGRSTQEEFAGADARFVINSDASITAVSPPFTGPVGEGNVDVVVMGPGGQSERGAWYYHEYQPKAQDAFRYELL